MRSMLPLAVALALVGCTPKDTTGDATDSGTGASNQKPIAEAGSPITQSADSAVSLSGAASSDPDGDALTWHWSFDHVPEGSALTSREAPFTQNHSVEAVASSFSPDVVGTYVVKLIVTDAKGLDSDPDFVIITVEEPENLPVANAGTDLTTRVGTSVSLDGSRSYDPLGRTLTYTWSLIDKPSSSQVGNVTGADQATASLNPDVKGVYVASLVVSNGLAPSLADAVTITALGDDHAPVANAGADQEVEDCTTVTLDCASSADPDGDALTYMWEVQSKPSGSAVSNASFSDRSAARPTFWPDQAGDYVLSCAVSDGTTWSSPDLVNLEASERRSNSRPVADAGLDATVSGGSATCEESGYSYSCDECATVTATLGSTAAVSDPDGDPYTVLWTTDNTDATIADPTSLVTTVTLEDAEPTEPGECEEVEFEFTLEVTDCTGASTTDRITLSVECCGVEATDTSAR